jgi:4-hydroxybenzoate polyprenyltransferase
MFLFIIFSIIVWIITVYFYYVGVIIVSAIVSLAINLYQTNKLNKKIHEMAYYEVQLNVLR